MEQRLTISFRLDLSMIESPAGAILQTPRVRIELNAPSDAMRSALRTLSGGGHSEEVLCDRVRDADGAIGVARLQLQLGQYARLGLLRYTLRIDGEPLVTVEPMAGGVAPAPVKIEPDVRYRLSRFALCRRDGEALVLESPRALARVRLAAPLAMAIVGQLATPRTVLDLSRACPPQSEAAARALLGLLAGLDLAGGVDESGALAEDTDPPMESWEFHDLLFHTRSRGGRHDHASGGTYRFRNTLPPLPALKPPMSGSVIRLDRPDLDRLAREDPPFIQIAESRRSIRSYGDRPITRRQLGEFLYRVGRVRSVTGPAPLDGRLCALTNRPYPNGGALYELELYLVVNLCDDLSAGLYHYDPLAHTLEHLCGRTGRIETLLADASRSAHLAGLPQVLIGIASRFQRRSWKYAGTAYANTLKNVGVLYQTMYLVATAMGLAPCAIGVGDAELFAASAGLDPEVETSVGEFVLGSL